MTLFETIGFFYVCLATVSFTAGVLYCAWIGSKRLREDAARGRRTLEEPE